MDKKYNMKAAMEYSRKLGRKLTAEEMEKFEIKQSKPGELTDKIFSQMSGQTGVEKKSKNKVGHILDTSNRALGKILNKIEKAAY